MLKRLLIGSIAVYGLFAIFGRFVEAMGAANCACQPDCWCQRPGLSTFRWVVPFGHHQWSADEKAALDRQGQ